jgi:hypothetical protein
MEKGYCVKCRAKREVVNPKVVKFGKRKAMQGLCKKCGTKVTKFIAG